MLKNLNNDSLHESTNADKEGRKPPLGLTPEKLYWEMCRSNRTRDIIDAMDRYASANMDIPLEWVKELISAYHLEVDGYDNWQYWTRSHGCFDGR